MIKTIVLIINVIISLFVAINIINNLYISKNYTKHDDFHLYNDLFSWESFFIIIAIANILEIISLLFITDEGILNILLKARMLILYISFLMKIVHIEQIMNIITYERHQIVVMIPMVILIILAALNIGAYTLFFILIFTTFIPYIILISVLKSSIRDNKEKINLVIGSIFIASGITGSYEIFKEFMIISEIVFPTAYFVGTIIIFVNIKKYLIKTIRKN